MRLFKDWAKALALLVSFSLLAHAVTIQSFNGTGTNSTTVEHTWDDSGNYTANGTITSKGLANTGTFTNTGAQTVTGNLTTNANIVQGFSGVSQSTITTSANNALGFNLYLASNSVTASQGMVIMATTSYSTQGLAGAVTPATNGILTALGVADATTSTGSIVTVDYAGVVVALTTGAVSIGDLLVTTNTAQGYLATNNSATAETVIATALESGITAGGLTRVLLRR